MRAWAANCVFWPGIDQAIQDVRSRCRTCDYIAPAQAEEPAITAEPPVYPFQQVAVDYCQLDGATYLVVVDRYSGWPSVQHFPRTTATSKGLIDSLKRLVHDIRGAGGIIIRRPVNLHKPGDEGLFEGMGSKAQVILDLFSSLQHQGGVGGEGNEEVDEG